MLHISVHWSVTDDSDSSVVRFHRCHSICVIRRYTKIEAVLLHDHGIAYNDCRSLLGNVPLREPLLPE